MPGSTARVTTPTGGEFTQDGTGGTSWTGFSVDVGAAGTKYIVVGYATQDGTGHILNTSTLGAVTPTVHGQGVNGTRRWGFLRFDASSLSSTQTLTLRSATSWSLIGTIWREIGTNSTPYDAPAAYSGSGTGNTLTVNTNVITDGVVYAQACGFETTDRGVLQGGSWTSDDAYHPDFVSSCNGYRTNFTTGTGTAISVNYPTGNYGQGFSTLSISPSAGATFIAQQGLVVTRQARNRAALW